MNTAKIILSWNCNMRCSYCCNKLQHIKDSFIPIRQSELKDLPHKDFELTGGEITISQTFSCLCEILNNWLPKERNYYVYTNGIRFTQWHGELLKRRNVKGINIGFHPNQPVFTHVGSPYVILRHLNWPELIKVNNIIPIRLWIQDVDLTDELKELPFELRVWKLGDCDNITTDRFVLRNN